jgi:hypothetical protein
MAEIHIVSQHKIEAEATPRLKMRSALSSDLVAMLAFLTSEIAADVRCYLYRCVVVRAAVKEPANPKEVTYCAPTSFLFVHRHEVSNLYGLIKLFDVLQS